MKKLMINNPDDDTLKQLVSQMPNAKLTQWGNYSVNTRVTARLNQYTYLVAPHTSKHPTLEREEYHQIAQYQDAYIKKIEMLTINGAIGCEDVVCVPVRLIVENRAANIAAMQRHLYFPNKSGKEPIFTIIYTPNLLPNFQKLQFLIAVDLQNYTTRIFGTDYFGESKKAGLRMWNKWVYEKGGLALHAGCKTYLDKNKIEWSIVIIGLSGTGKTTTTFNQHRNSLPVQDDFCALFPNGRIYSSENGCFAKTHKLDERNEPEIYRALKNPQSWLENVFVDHEGKVDYFNSSLTSNGRGTFELQIIPHREPHHLPPVSHILFLNRNFDIIPGIARLNEHQIADYFLLGETTGTSAGGSSESGKSMRVPGTNPFFPSRDILQATRFDQIIHANPDIQVVLMNTGCIGGHEASEGSLKISIENSSALIEALLDGQILWQEDHDFGYELASNAISGCPSFITKPFLFYEKMNRDHEYCEIVNNLKHARKEYLVSIKENSSNQEEFL